MKSDNAKQRKKNRIRPYQIKPDKKQKETGKKGEKRLNNNDKNNVPEIPVGVKVA